jgi:hypothetical protein
MCVEDIFDTNSDPSQRQGRRICRQCGELLANLLRIMPRPGAYLRFARGDPGKLLF